MTRIAWSAPAPGALEAYCRTFDPVFSTGAQRRGFRRYLEGLLLPRDRHKTLTGLAGTEPRVGAQAAPAQRLQYFLCEARWNADAVNAQRLRLLRSNPGTAPHARGVLLVDDTGSRKWGVKTDHVAKQYLRGLGRMDRGIVSLTSLWVDERLRFPLHVQPYSPAPPPHRCPAGPACRSKIQIVADLIAQAREAEVPFSAVVGDCAPDEVEGLHPESSIGPVPFVFGLRESPAPGAGAAQERAARGLAPDAWVRVLRRLPDGHRELGWAAELGILHGSLRTLAVTSDPRTLPEHSTCYIGTNLPAPGAATGPFTEAGSGEVVRLYDLGRGVQDRHNHLKQRLGWADFAVRSDRAIRRHWHLILCALSFCHWADRQQTDLPGEWENARLLAEC